MATVSWHSLDAASALRELGTDPASGLSDEEVARRLEQYGANELRQEGGVSPLSLLLRQFKNTLLIILLVATVLSALVGELFDAGLILAIVVFSAVLGFAQEYRAEKSLDALKRMLAPTITVRRAGAVKELPSKELVPGDVMLLEAGDRVPADGRVIEAHSVRCDEASLTGESTTVSKDPSALGAATALGDRRNMVFAGTNIAYGRCVAVVTATAMTTEFGLIAEQAAAIVQDKTPLELRTEEIGKWVAIISLSICGLVVGVSLVRELLFGEVTLEFTVTILIFAVALAVAAVSEALAAIVTGALAIGMHEMAKRHAVVRRMQAVETLGCTTVICSDKTGTLTKGEMTVRRLFVGGENVDVSGVGYAPEGTLSRAVDGRALQLLLEGGLLCNDASLARTDGRWSIVGDPTEGALVVLAAKAGMDTERARAAAPRVKEHPFSSERKRMTTIHAGTNGTRTAFVKGAPEVLLLRCSFLQQGDGRVPLDDSGREALLAANRDMAAAALRVVGVAYKELALGESDDEEAAESDLVFLGLVAMMDPPREEAVAAVRTCREVHVKPVMITGDHQLTAVAVAREIGIHREGDLVLTGEDLARLDDDGLAEVVERVSVYARVSPMDKLKIIKAWKRKGQVVAMTGDGVNDAPALKHADIGVAMGITGTEVAKEASDIVLTDDNFASIVRAIELGRWIYDNIKKYLAYLLRANITEVIVLGGVTIVLGPEFLPLLPAAILYLNLATDGLPALALGLSPPDPDVMKRPPRDPKESVFSHEVRTLIALGVLIETPIFLWIFFRDLPDLTMARTQVFLLFVIVELVIALNFRSLRYGITVARPHKWLLIAIAWELVLLAVLLQIPAVREAFGIGMPRLSDLWLVGAVSIGVFVSVEATKLVLARRSAASART
ncbi:MAG: cation-translocating P-type ATPase [Candidatus Eiseniibacteriota bacterium]